MVDLLDQDGHFLVGELFGTSNVLKVVWVLCHERALAKHFRVLGEALFPDKVLDLGHELGPGDAGERVLDLGVEVLGEIALFDGRVVVDAMLSVGLRMVVEPLV